MSELKPMECPRCRQQGRESEVFEALIARTVCVPGLSGLVGAASGVPAIGGQYRCSNGHRFDVWWDKEIPDGE